MIICINYANDKFTKQQRYNNITAKFFGDFDKIISYSQNDIDTSFRDEHKDILKQDIGGGYWLWKSYFIKKTMDEINYGDFLFYCDSGAIFLNSVKKMIQEFEQLRQPVLGFQLPLIEKQWTKKETFVIMDALKEEFLNSPQLCASYIFIKKNDKSIKFVNDFLSFCINEKALIDKIFDYTNDEKFVHHRHDQSIFSLLYKKYGYKPLPDPSDFGHFPEAYCQPTNRLISKTLLYPKYAGTLLSFRTSNPFFYTLKYFGKRLIKKTSPSFYNKHFNPRNIKFRYTN